MEAVDFILNNKLISFEATIEECVNLLNDDEYTLDFITRAVRTESLIQYGITADNFPDVIRASKQPHAPEALRRLEANERDVDVNECDTESQKKSVQTSSETDIVWVSHKKSPLDNEATKFLLNLRGRPEYQRMFSDKKNKKINIWQKIAEEMKKAGYNLGESIKQNTEKCRQKFANLQKSYINFLDSVKKTGAEYQSKPAYFDDIHKILGEKDKVSPKFLIDSMTSSNEKLIPTDVDLAEAGPSTRNVDISSDSETQSRQALEDPTMPKNRFTAAKKTVREQNTKGNIVEVIKEMNEKQINELKNITSIIKDNMEKQNALLQTQSEQRQELINILKTIVQSDSKTSKIHHKKRRRSSTSSD
ncbi:unnamed protein product [Psylliodes chrysocephalus]|uniref:Myb/SANT-like DNA-binding domain-containing protein n=1 Tax=Psylliodes chrysocephalus TaxID=3402493 RepID=A0A9P0GD55_9CUCU|nr:unnamed protein product [Psylliodes chrysocephala]